MGLRLALIGSIRDEILNIDELALELIKYLMKSYPQLLKERYELAELAGEVKVLEEITQNRNCVKKGNEPDYAKAAALILEEYRSGKIGRITLESPQNI